VESIQELVQRFRRLFPDLNRKEMQEEFRHLCGAMCVTGESLTAIQFVAALRKTKQSKEFRERDLRRIFECMDADDSGRVSFNEFVKVVRVSERVASYCTVLYCVNAYLYYIVIDSILSYLICTAV
jgi:Ca2+-binding EF-hand superfamily protein